MMRSGPQNEPDTRIAIQSVHVLRGPNLWSNSPILEAWLDLGSLKDVASNEVPGFNDRLIRSMPTMVEHRCSIGERGGFFERLRRGTYAAHILEHVCLELQSLAGTPVGFGKARAMGDEGHYRVVVRYEDEILGRASLREARALLLSAYDDRPFDVDASVSQLSRLASVRARDPGTRVLLKAAKARHIPVIPLSNEGLLQLGHGKRQRRLRLPGMLGDKTSAVAEELASDRCLHRPLLKSAGIPIADWSLAHSAEEAWECATDLEVPVIVKPLYRDDNPAYFRRLGTKDEVTEAYGSISEKTSFVSVEKAVPGHAVRLLVVDDCVLATDGDSHYPRPEPGDIDPQISSTVVEAARVVGLDFAEVGLIASTFEKPLQAQSGVVTWVRARPNLNHYLTGEPQRDNEVVGGVISALFGETDDGRIPLVAVIGGEERRDVSSHIAQFMRSLGKRVGLARAGHAQVDERPLLGRWRGLFDAARSLLMHPDVELLVVEVSRGDVLTEGLPFDRCTVGVVTGLDAYAELLVPGWGFDDPTEELPRAERCIVDVVDPTGFAVLNTDEPVVAPMAKFCKGAVISYSESPVNPAGNAAGKAVWKRGRSVVLVDERAAVQEFVFRSDAEASAARPCLAAAWALGVDSDVAAAWLQGARVGAQRSMDSSSSPSVSR
jgi:hypothetical protein